METERKKLYIKSERVDISETHDEKSRFDKLDTYRIYCRLKVTEKTTNSLSNELA